nr:vacuole membrane protein 1 [Drosophila kikkawai]
MSANIEVVPSVDHPTDETDECKSLVLWRRPVQTLNYAGLEVCQFLLFAYKKLMNMWLLGFSMFLGIICFLPGPHADYVILCKHHLGFAIYWLFLGVLTSVGFGAGLHTFLLYLGPHIAAVTLAVQECGTLNFPAPPYPDMKICPPQPYQHQEFNEWDILAKVRPEALFWGLGTALGELPSYFVARSARLSGKKEESELVACGRPGTSLSLLERVKQSITERMGRVSFVAILLAASVPNPLFDMTGITCGHFLVPFWRFFVAILIGKTLVKATIQQVCVIVAFTDDLVDQMANWLVKVPYLGPPLHKLIREVLRSTKQQMHGGGKSDSQDIFNIVVWVFEFLALVMVSSFVISSVNCLAQVHCRRQQEERRKKRELEMILSLEDFSV